MDADYESHPVRVVFGPGRRAETGADVDRLGLAKVMVIADGATPHGPVLADVLGGRLTTYWDEIAQHVPIELAERAGARAVADGADCLRETRARWPAKSRAHPTLSRSRPLRSRRCSGVASATSRPRRTGELCTPRFWAVADQQVHSIHAPTRGDVLVPEGLARELGTGSPAGAAA